MAVQTTGADTRLGTISDFLLFLYPATFNLLIAPLQNPKSTQTRIIRITTLRWWDR